MNHNEILNSIKFIRPNAVFALKGDVVEWLDEQQTEPTKKEIETGWLDYQTHLKAEAEAKAAQKAALLNRLGITEDEARLLLS